MLLSTTPCDLSTRIFNTCEDLPTTSFYLKLDKPSAHGILALTMTGHELAAKVATPPPVLPALVENFLYERTTFMITGEAGKGKSVIASQLCLSLSSATPLFGALLIPKPRKVYYLQLEGSEYDFLSRLYYQQQTIPLNPHNLYWDRDVKFNAADPQQRAAKIHQITTVFGNPDLVIIDPIYKAVGGDLAKAEFALALIDFLEVIEERCKCSVLLFHHPHREKLDIRGKKIKETDAYYGHSFIRNHIETAFAFTQVSEDGQESELERTKLREERILPKLSLVYHPESYTCSMLPIDSTTTKRDLVLQYLYRCLREGRPTSFSDVKLSCGPISTTHLRELQVELASKGWLKLAKRSGHRTVWLPMAELSQVCNGMPTS